jgi:hypothetical protein
MLCDRLRHAQLNARTDDLDKLLVAIIPYPRDHQAAVGPTYAVSSGLRHIIPAVAQYRDVLT